MSKQESDSKKGKDKFYPSSQFRENTVESTNLAGYQSIKTLFENSVSCQKVVRVKKTCRSNEGLFKMTFLVFNQANIKKFGSMYAAEENNIEQLLNLKLMEHPHIAGIKDVIIHRHTLTTISDYCDAPRLYSFICNQKLYFSEKVIAQIARQILEALQHAAQLGIRHGSLDESCIYVTNYD